MGSTTVSPVHIFPPPSKLLVCYQPHRQTAMPGQKSIYETFLVNTERRASPLILIAILPRLLEGQHGFYCDGSLKELAAMLSFKLLSTAVAFVLHMMWWKSSMPSHARTLCRALWHGELLNVIVRQLYVFYIFIEKLVPSFKGSDLWKMRGVEKLASVQRLYRTVAIDVCLSFYEAVVFSATYISVSCL